MAYLLSEKRRRRFVDGRYIFWSDGVSKLNPQLLFWRCSRRPGCKARLHTTNDEIVQGINEHTHVEDGCNVQRARIVERVREEASTSRENPEMLISNATFGLKLYFTSLI